MKSLRESAVDGMFYPENKAALLREIDEYLQKADVKDTPESTIGIVAPHAGYMYSGQVAAYSYKAIEGKPYELVYVVGPSHRARFNGVAVWDKGAFETPIGKITIDEYMVEQIIASHGIVMANRDVHLEEHSLEVQLPFLQRTLGTFSLVPLVMGVQTPEVCEELAQLLFGIIQKNSGVNTLIVCSTDLSHYYSYERSKILDSVVLGDLNAFDVSAMIHDTESGRTEACGAGALISVMMLCQMLGANRGKVLSYANSGDISGDQSAVVGYVSAVFYKESH